MYNFIFMLFATLHVTLKDVSAAYLEAESNYVKPNSQHNNKVNKRVWFKGNNKNEFDKVNAGDFIFRANSLDVDNLVQNNFDPFVENYLQDIPIVTSYIERSKRSNRKRRHLRKSLINCDGQANCNTKMTSNKNVDDKISQTTLIAETISPPVFKDYPYEISVIHNNNDKDDKKNRHNNQDNNINLTVIPLNDKKEIDAGKAIENKLQIEESDKKMNVTEDIISLNKYTSNNGTMPKRSTKNDYESLVIKKLEFVESLNETDDHDANRIRSVYDKEKVWHQTVPLPNTSVYKVVPKVYDSKKSKPVNERGLIKVLAMLTKSFKKIMKQHEDIKNMHSKMTSVYDDFIKNIQPMTKKVQEFDRKYTFLLKIVERVKKLEDGLSAREKDFDKKEKELTKSMMEFETQQKQFLAQQRQFYNIQKIMLAQNEKINVKQNLIAKTQSEISHRHNDFARILKKAKQLYAESKSHATKINATFKSAVKMKTTTTTTSPVTATHTTTTTALKTEPIKIDLFSLPTTSRLKNQDELILKEKDDQPVDELIYKYYFNNTYIDNLMKSKILSSLSNTHGNTEARNAKNKRNEEIDFKTTVLFPVNKNDTLRSTHNRKKRWIHHSRRKLHRKNRGKENVAFNEINDQKTANLKEINRSDHLRYDITNDVKTDNNLMTKTVENAVTNGKDNKNNPFFTMAWNFCKEIRPNANEQILNWCVEKVLRKLQNIHTNVPMSPVPLDDIKVTKNKSDQIETASKSNKAENVANTTKAVTSTPLTETTTIALTSVTTNLMESNNFFPDNEELESNLKKYELIPDTEGNVYYDGSLHASDIKGDSDAISDIMPGLDSNSHVEMDPLAFDIQARRRADVRRLNANLLQKISRGLL